MSSAPSYFTDYENFALTRDEDGVLLVRLHTEGSEITFTAQTHQDFPDLLEKVALDTENTVMVLTGTGDAFMDRIDGTSLGDIHKPAHWEKFRVEGVNVLQRLIELPIPVVGVANGPATLHSEYLLLTDIHIASDRATYADLHPAFGLPGGDGVQVVWDEIVGAARAKWLLWTGESIDAATALDWGVVSEVVAHDRALSRGMEIARGLSRSPRLYRTLQKQTVNRAMRMRLLTDVPMGLALEGLTAANLAYLTQTPD